MGIMCGHELAIITQKKVRTIPTNYVLEDRWSKDMRRRHTYIAMYSNDFRTTTNTARFGQISKLFHERVNLGAESNDWCRVVTTGLHELKDRIDKFICNSNEPADTPSVAKQATMTVEY